MAVWMYPHTHLSLFLCRFLLFGLLLITPVTFSMMKSIAVACYLLTFYACRGILDLEWQQELKFGTDS
jgi:hypothetical protein